MNVELVAYVLAPEEQANLALVGQQTPDALAEGTLSATFAHLASIDQILSAFKTAAGPFGPAAPSS
jgi:hypothetical protein